MKKKRLISVLMSFCFLLSVIPFVPGQVSYAEPFITEDGEFLFDIVMSDSYSESAASETEQDYSNSEEGFFFDIVVSDSYSEQTEDGEYGEESDFITDQAPETETEIDSGLEFETTSSSLLSGTAISFSVENAADAMAALDVMGFYYGYENAETVLENDFEQDTGLYKVYSFSQTYEGLPVIGHRINVIVDQNGTVLNFSGNYIDTHDLSVTPEIGADEAAEAVLGADSEFRYQAKLCIYVLGEDPYLAWKITAGITSCYVDAQTGDWLAAEELFSYDENLAESLTEQLTGQNEIRSVEVTYDGENYYLIDQGRNISLYEFSIVDTTQFNDANLICSSTLDDINVSAVDALYNTELVYDFYSTVLNHTATDGAGEADLYVGVGTTQAYGEDGNLVPTSGNSHGGADVSENESVLIFDESEGQYDGAYYLEVVSHEYSHAVQKYMIGGNNYSTSEGGAIDEAISDIMAVLCDAFYNDGVINWQLEDNFGGVRDLASPSGDCISTYEEYTDDLDAHTASTLISHIAYLMNSQPDLDSSYAIEDYRTLARLWYNALYLMNTSSRFSDCRAAVERTAGIMAEKGELTEKQYQGVRMAFDEAGIPYSDSEFYFVNDDTEIEVLVLDRNNDYAWLQYPHFSVTVTSEDGSYVKTMDNSTGSVLVKDLIGEDTGTGYIYELTFSDLYTEEVSTITIYYLPNFQLGFPDLSDSEAEPYIHLATDFGSSTWITGTVKDEYGNALDNVTVTLDNLDNLGVEAIVQTDQEGKYRLFLYYESQPFSLSFSRTLCEDQSYSDTLSSTEIEAAAGSAGSEHHIKDVILEYEKGTLFGITCDSSDQNTSIPGATVTATRIDDDPEVLFKTSFTTRSDSNGAYSIDLPAGHYDVDFSADGCQPYEGTQSVEIGKDMKTELNGLLITGLFLAGSVWDEDGNPLSDVSVNAVSVSGMTSNGTTDENGNYTLICLCDSYEIQFSRTGYQSETVSVTTTEEMFDENSKESPLMIKTVRLVSKQAVLRGAPHNSSLKVLGSDIGRSSIKHIVFLDTLSDLPSDAWDVSLKENGSVMAWVKPAEDPEYPDAELYTLYIAGEGGVYASDCEYLFYDYRNLESIEFNDCFHTENITSMYRMFKDSFKKGSIVDLTGLDTSSVTDMSEMFIYCNFAELSLGDIDTSNVTTMAWMFSGCHWLETVDAGGWDLSSVTDLEYMFAQCIRLTSLDVSSWDTSSVTSLKGTFFRCESLTALDVSHWQTSNVRIIVDLFWHCEALEELDLSGWDLSNLINYLYDNNKAFEGTKWEKNWRELVGTM